MFFIFIGCCAIACWVIFLLTSQTEQTGQSALVWLPVSCCIGAAITYQFFGGKDDLITAIMGAVGVIIGSVLGLRIDSKLEESIRKH